MAAAIEFQGVAKKFGENTVISGMDMEIKQGERFVLVGSSGSGKTTSLKMINRLEDPSAGQVMINGKLAQEYPLQELRWMMGYVLQQIALFPNMTVAQNITLIPEMKGTPRAQLKEMTDSLLDQVGLDPQKYRDRYPKELSGGEQQRVGILRAISSQPPIVLMDEPFSALDPISRESLQDLVIKLHKQLGNTIVFVTHDMDEALKIGDRIGIMSQGQLLQAATPQEIARHPANDFVRDFFAGSVAKNIYETPLSQLLWGENILQQKPQAAEDIPNLREDAALRELFTALSTHDYVRVQSRSGQDLGYLNRQLLVNYLSASEKQGE
ncbi:glycine betaine/carnitine/choline ABC transporter ATP-binding protein [Ligilactobacillus salitolerans]|uniref:ABC-type quaternary amine transporter n=1 Tax=Ligilactobacillus salitolerans TaxID=1808352 RepID=A0A401IPU5_9LACO|nr:ABC transporter ATP-binding protein [Ligilactobacillus salitolerans]GBG93561.1 glycine betaine/carnitine/choline ABC transporter ATP-binding protein [Ligilactobacillus salitolerans]